MKCKLKNCNRAHYAKGFCGSHYQRFLKYGSRMSTEPIRTVSKGYINNRGYRVISVKGKEVLEHRHIMAVYLGRKLEPSEHVHHKNENRADNRIKNLELMSPGEHQKHHHQKKSNTDKSKLCARCSKVKPRASFYKNSARHDGCAVYCRTCQREYDKSYYNSKHPTGN